MKISQSRIAPHINIQYESNADYAKAESALGRINQGHVGSSLIRAIRDLTNNGRSLTINVNNQEMSQSFPSLTPNQVLKYNSNPSCFDTNHNILATRLASKTSTGMFGEGTGSVIDWNSSISVLTDRHGKSKATKDESQSYISLAHEMIHSYGMMKGTFEGGGGIERYNKGTSSNIEELKVIGITPYNNEYITENKIRGEHGLYSRTKYKVDEFDIDSVGY